MSRRSASTRLFFGLGCFRFRNIATSHINYLGVLVVAPFAFSGGNIQRLGAIPDAVVCNLLRLGQTKKRRGGVAPNGHVRQINDLTGHIA
jgi:hypothetical protein